MSLSYSIARACHLVRLAIFCISIPLLAGVTIRICSAQDAKKADPKPPPAEAAPADSQFIHDTPDEKLKNNFQKIKKIIQDGSLAGGNQATLDDYLENYEFKRWTQEKNFPTIASLRSQFRTSCKQAKTTQMHDHLNQMALDILGKKVKNKKYPPVFRVNAMLAIGELNAVEGSNPTPLPAALPVLLETLDDAQQLDGVKIAALCGIRRHVVSGVKDPAVAKAALKLASSEENDVGKAWMRRQAVEILGYLQSPGANNQVVNLLLAIIADKKAPLKLRCAAAEALGQINLSNAAGLKAADLLAALTQLMQDGCQAELKDAEKAGSSVSPRIIKSYMGTVTAALGDANKGVNSLKDVDKKQITSLQAILKELLATFDNEESSDSALTKAVETALKGLEAFTKTKP